MYISLMLVLSAQVRWSCLPALVPAAIVPPRAPDVEITTRGFGKPMWWSTCQKAAVLDELPTRIMANPAFNRMRSGRRHVAKVICNMFISHDVSIKKVIFDTSVITNDKRLFGIISRTDK